jgi:hypothetical protein
MKASYTFVGKCSVIVIVPLNLCPRAFVLLHASLPFRSVSGQRPVTHPALAVFCIMRALTRGWRHRSQLHDPAYMPIDPRYIRIPLPEAPGPELLQAVDLFYQPDQGPLCCRGTGWLFYSETYSA